MTGHEALVADSAARRPAVTGFDPGLLTGGPDKDWPSADFRWGPAGVTLRSNGPDVLTWARQCFTAVPGQPDQAAGELERAVVVVHDELARKLAACCTKPLPGGERLQVECGEGEGMALVRVTALVTPAHRAKRSWPLVLVFAQAPGSDLYAFTTSDPQGSRAGEILVRQILDRQLHRRDATLLHAAGVVLDGRALLFLGDAGWGKTTLATWGTVVQGGQFLAGDRVAAYLDGDVPIAVSYARSARY